MDNPTQRATTEPSATSPDEEYDVRYWTKALGVDEKTLREAVQALGNRAVARPIDLPKSHKSNGPSAMA